MSIVIERGSAEGKLESLPTLDKQLPTFPAGSIKSRCVEAANAYPCLSSFGSSRWSADHDRGYSLRADVRLEKDERGIARISPLVNHTVWFEQTRTSWFHFRFPFDRHRPGSGRDVIERGTGTIMGRIGRHSRRKRNTGERELVRTWL
jgi:hypothetical protein